MGSSSHLNLLQRVFWCLPWLSHVIHKEHAATKQFLQSRRREQQYLWRAAGRTRELSQPPATAAGGGTPAPHLPWNCTWGHCLQGLAQHQCLELAPSQKIPGYGSDGGGKRAGSEGRLTASSDAQPESRRGPGGCGNGAAALGSHRWGCRKKARIQDKSKLTIF